MDTGPLGVQKVLEEEYRALRPEQREGAPAAPLSALSLSGGGIRSATFAWGVIQGLADEEVLGRFDYLSTVSGGGYIGSWLTCWKQRARGIENVLPQLRSDAPPVSEKSPDPIEHLRKYNNYLAPHVGTLSVDTWTVIATILRNMFLNWLVFVPLLLAALMAPRLLLSLARLGETFPDFYGGSPWLSAYFLSRAISGIAAFFFAMTVCNILRYLPGVGGVNHTEKDFLRYCLLPFVLSVAAFLTNDSWFTGGDMTRAGVTVNELLSFRTLTVGVVGSAFAGWLAYFLFCRPGMKRSFRLFLPVSAAVLLAGATASSAAWFVLNTVYPSTTWPVYTTVALPLMLLALTLAGFLFVGLTSSVLEDKDREWLARAAAWVLLLVVAWTIACAMVLIVPQWAFTLPLWGKSALAALGTAAGWSSALAGLSPRTEAHSADSAPPSGTPPRSLPLSIAAKLAAPVFAGAFLVGLAMVTNWLLRTTRLGTLSNWSDAQSKWVITRCPDCSWWDHRALLEGTRWECNLLLAVAFLAVAAIMARYININTFSLQQMYLVRLVRAYLGASNDRPDANDFTGFSQSDNMRIRDLDPHLKPFHVVNVTLNLVGTERLDWQQRKAESFTMSALHCGSANLGYRPSAGYGGKKGLTFGMAIATSGAAASPAMGYHSSRVVAFIMTLFNARLGCWLGNPGPAGEKTWQKGSPTSAGSSIVAEAFGLTNDTNPWVYLSDGGHFENLAIYEMVRRRCRYVVVSDGGCDPHFTYEDLGNALRKIRIDMKIPVDFDEASFEALRKQSQRYAIARIRYSLVDRGAEDGYLLYIKPMMRGNEPPDVLSYQSQHPDFPHQSTADQFFDESQTESYRMLGLHSAHEVLAALDRKGPFAWMWTGTNAAAASSAG